MNRVLSSSSTDSAVISHLPGRVRHVWDSSCRARLPREACGEGSPLRPTPSVRPFCCPCGIPRERAGLRPWREPLWPPHGPLTRGSQRPGSSKTSQHLSPFLGSASLTRGFTAFLMCHTNRVCQLPKVLIFQNMPQGRRLWRVCVPTHVCARVWRSLILRRVSPQRRRVPGPRSAGWHVSLNEADENPALVQPTLEHCAVTVTLSHKYLKVPSLVSKH